VARSSSPISGAVRRARPSRPEDRPLERAALGGGGGWRPWICPCYVRIWRPRGRGALLWCGWREGARHRWRLQDDNGGGYVDGARRRRWRIRAVPLEVVTGGSEGVGCQPVWEVQLVAAAGCHRIWPLLARMA
jgi:hypothetical protein